jgi:VWFA-related protein
MRWGTAILLALGLLAQGPVKITVNTQLVVETVSVTDKSGKPIEGLTAKDFVVTEDGVVQTVSFCEYQTLQGTSPAAPVAAAAPALAPAPVGDQVAPVTRGQIAPERPGDVRYKDRRLLALYFDMSAMPVPDQLRAQAAAIKFIRTQMAPSDLMAILSFSDGVHVLRDFTDNRDDLEKTVNKLFVGEAQGFEFTDDDDSSADTGTAFGEDDTEFNLFNTDRQLAALQTAAKMLGTLNEKKVLIYFASGLRLSGVDNQAQFQAIRRWPTSTIFSSRRIRCTRWRRIRAGRRCWTITT